MPVGPCPKHGYFKIVDANAKASMRVTSGGGDGLFWEGARVVGCAWSLSLPAKLATVVWSIFFRLLILRWLWMSCLFFLLTPYATSSIVRRHFSYEISLAGLSYFFGSVVRFPSDISCFWMHNFRMRVHAFWPLWDFMRFPYEFSYFLTPRRFPEEISCFLLHIFLKRLPYATSCFFLPL